MDYIAGLDLGQRQDHSALVLLERTEPPDGPCTHALRDANRLTIAAGLKERPTLLDELRKFQRRFTQAANEQFGSWREGTHDDFVLALALACWYAEQNRPAHVWFINDRSDIDPSTG